MPMEKALGPVGPVKFTPMMPGRQLPPPEKLIAPETYWIRYRPGVLRAAWAADAGRTGAAKLET